MSLRPEYFQYLDHIQSSVTLAEFQAQPDRENLITLRHDVDYDLDLALEMARCEAERGLHATYFLLHSTDYWSEPDFHLKCRQLAAYGHEVAFHCNVLTEWMRGEIDDVHVRIQELLAYLRESGVPVVGTSAHGDRTCYERQFINFWVWQELRGSDPASTQQGRCAEGPHVDELRWQIAYPKNHALMRADGRGCLLWSTSLEAEGLAYDAAHMPFDFYWTDSGGRWKRSGDPLEADLSRGRHQVLMHPIWWRGTQRQFYVASTARSGSTWLARFVDRATSCRGYHEWTLNHVERNGQMVPDKQTGCDFQNLLEDRDEVSARIAQAAKHFSKFKGDTLEANVYLEPVLEKVIDAVPAAEIIHLFRNGPDVIRSLINRDWYRQPEDRSHPPVAGAAWSTLNQFERACWYYRLTNERIANATSNRWQFERLVGDLGYLTERLEQLGIVVHPLLAEAVFAERVNASATTDFPAWDEWSQEYQDSYRDICGETDDLLDYSPRATGPTQLHCVESESSVGWRMYRHVRNACGGIGSAVSRLTELARQGRRASQVEQLLAIEFECRDSTPLIIDRKEWQNVRLTAESGGLVLMPTGETFENSYFLLSPGSWQRVKRHQGYPARAGAYYRGKIDAKCPENFNVRVIALMYDRKGKLLRKLHVANLRHERPEAEFSFSVVPPEASHFSIALHMDAPMPGPVVLQSVHLERVPLPAGYQVRHQAAIEQRIQRPAA